MSGDQIIVIGEVLKKYGSQPIKIGVELDGQGRLRSSDRQSCGCTTQSLTIDSALSLRPCSAPDRGVNCAMRVHDRNHESTGFPVMLGHLINFRPVGSKVACPTLLTVL